MACIGNFVSLFFKYSILQLHQKQLNSKVNLQSPDKDGQILSDDHQQPAPVSQGKDNKRLSDGYQQPDPNGDADDDIVPVVIRPGHIRFEPLGKGLMLSLSLSFCMCMLWAGMETLTDSGI